MDKLNHRSEGEIIGDKKPVNSEPKKFVELADKLPRDGSRDNCILSEFMQMRESKFSKVTNDNDVINYQTDTDCQTFDTCDDGVNPPQHIQ